MRKRELVKAAAGKSSLTQRQISEAIDVVFATIAEALAGGDQVVLRNLGRFSAWQRQQQIRGFDGQSYQIDQPQIMFKASAALRRQTRGPEDE